MGALREGSASGEYKLAYLRPEITTAGVSARPPVIVLTGGPCGGKTTLVKELREEDPEGRKWVLAPEAAPLLFQAGLSAREKAFQAAVVRLQMALEDACALVAPRGAVL